MAKTNSDSTQDSNAIGVDLQRLVRLLAEVDSEERRVAEYRNAAWKLAGSKLRNMREVLGLSLREAARRMNITAPYLSDMERGNRRPSPEWAKKLLREANK